MVQQLSTNTFGTAKWIVSPTLSNGTHTTIAGALASAVSGDTIFIRPGTYTENIGLVAGVNLTAYDCDALTPNVTIVGKCSFSSAGTVTISGIRLQTNSDFLLAVTGSVASIVNLKNCYLNCTNNTGISFTSSSASAAINAFDCTGDLGTTGIAYYAHSSAGSMFFKTCFLTNSGTSTTANTCSSSGQVTIAYCQEWFSPLSFSSTSQGSLAYSRFFATNATVLAITSTSAAGVSTFFTTFESGTATAVTIAAGSLMTAPFITVDSTNAAVMSGAGTLKYGKIVYTNTGSTNTVTTKTAYTTLG